MKHGKDRKRKHHTGVSPLREEGREADRSQSWLVHDPPGLLLPTLPEDRRHGRFAVDFVEPDWLDRLNPSRASPCATVRNITCTNRRQECRDRILWSKSQRTSPAKQRRDCWSVCVVGKMRAWFLMPVTASAGFKRNLRTLPFRLVVCQHWNSGSPDSQEFGLLRRSLSLATPATGETSSIFLTNHWSSFWKVVTGSGSRELWNKGAGTSAATTNQRHTL